MLNFKITENLAHRNLQYVIVHGGINTINELMLFGVPILGIPLQVKKKLGDKILRNFEKKFHFSIKNGSFHKNGYFFIPFFKFLSKNHFLTKKVSEEFGYAIEILFGLH